MSSVSPSGSSTSQLLNTTFGSSGGTSTFQVSGLASGLNDAQIIQQLMSIAQLPQQAIIQQTTLETARQNDLKAIQSQLSQLSVAISKLVDPSTWSTSQQITTSDPNISATGTGVPPGGFQLAVSQLARAAQLTQGSSIANAAADDQLTIQVGTGTAFNVDVKAGDSLQTIASSINAAAGTQLYASVVNSKLVLSSQVTGAANTISVSSTGTLASDLGLTQTVTPRDAVYTVDGGSPQTSSTNQLTNIATGLTVKLNGVTSSPASVTVAQAGANSQGVQDALNNFVTVYNQTITAINDKLNEKKVVNPTTGADRAMGDLSGNSALSSLVDQLREAVTSAFAGAPAGFTTLSQVGLSTGAAVGTGSLNQNSIDGQLTLDTDTLGSQLAAGFQNVKNLFTNATAAYSSEGLAQRLNGILSSYTGTNGVLSSQINGESSLIASLNQQKADWDVRLADKQQALQTKFTAMETALSQLQSQGSWLSGQLSGLSANSKA
jgi:flagellar hook-associated protein 2